MSISAPKKNPLTTVTVLAALTVIFATVFASPPPARSDPPDNYATLEQIGSFSEKANAQALVDRYDRDGKVAFILEKDVGGKTFYSVVLDHSPPAIVQDSMKARTAQDEGKEVLAPVAQAAQVAQEAQEVVVPTMSGRSGPSIALMTDAALYDSPSADAAPLGTYDSLGRGRHVMLYRGSHTIWLPVMMRYGFASAKDVREADFAGSMEEEGSALEVVLPTQSGEPGPSIAIMTNTTLYNSPDANAAPLGTYDSLGEGRYVSMFMGYHGIEFPYMETYGFVSPDNARPLEYAPGGPMKVKADERKEDQADE